MSDVILLERGYIRHDNPWCEDSWTEGLWWSLVVKNIHASDVVYKDNMVVRNKKLSYYLLSLYVDYDWEKREHIDAFKRYKTFKKSEQE